MATAELAYLKNLSPEEKRLLLGDLVAELSAREAGPLTVTTLGQTYFLYRVPENAKENTRRFMEECPPEYWEEMRRRAEDMNPAHWLSMEEMLRLISEEADRSDRSQAPTKSANGTTG